MRKQINKLLVVIGILAGFCGVAIAEENVQTLSDGSTQLVVSNPDGSKLVQTIHNDGTSTSEILNPDGSKALSQTQNPDGSTDITTQPSSP